MKPWATLPGDPRGDGSEDASAFRWSSLRKREVLRRLDEGEMRLNEALTRFHLTLEEIEAWRAGDDIYRRRALRIGGTRQGSLL